MRIPGPLREVCSRVYMVFMNRRARVREQTKEEIVEAALASIEDGDPEALTIHGVARTVGVVPGALYRYFGSREILIAAVQARVVGDLVEEVRTPLEAWRSSPLSAVAGVAAAVVRYAARAPGRYALLSRMFAIPRPLVGEEAAGPALALAAVALSQVRRSFEVAVAEGELAVDDPDQCVLALWAGVHGAIQIGKLARFDARAGAVPVAQSMVRALLVGWGAAPEAASVAVQSVSWSV